MIRYPNYNLSYISPFARLPVCPSASDFFHTISNHDSPGLFFWSVTLAQKFLIVTTHLFLESASVLPLLLIPSAARSFSAERRKKRRLLVFMPISTSNFRGKLTLRYPRKNIRKKLQNCTYSKAFFY